MEPPPAPTETMSSTGVRIGRPSTSVSVLSAGTPFETRQTSVLVPPMSKVIRSLKPDWPACLTAPITPAAGPEKSAVMAFLDMPSAGSLPPLDCITLNRPVKPRAFRTLVNRDR